MSMDLVTSCKEKLVQFRIKELKDVLTQMGISKQGKKQDLVERVLYILSYEKEEVVTLVDRIYRKSHEIPETQEEEEKVEDRVNIRCLCGCSLQTDSLIQCQDPSCGVWQHIGCVHIQDKPIDGVLRVIPDIFYCEICRLKRGDPFLVSIGHPMYPVKLISTDGKHSVEKTFQLDRSGKDMVLKEEYDVQVWCMLLNDEVQFRMHWPQYAELSVNGVSVKVINRPGKRLLGINGRDEGATITKYTKHGINKISLTRCDSREFCFGVRLVRRCSFEQVLDMVPKESVGEKIEDALARVRRCIGAGKTDDDNDDDLDVVVDECILVSLRCPMSGSRMKVAGRFKPCLHMGCFDLEVFLRMNERSRKWQCPNCLQNYSLENLIIDPYFNCIISKMGNCGEDISEIEVKLDGSWRAKLESDLKDLGQLGLWHFADGSPCPTENIDPLKHVKQGGDGGSDGCQQSLNFGIRKDCNGFWEVSKLQAFENQPLNNIIQTSSTSANCGRDGKDASGNFEFSVSNGVELDQEVIVLSDSEEDNNDIEGEASGRIQDPLPLPKDGQPGSSSFQLLSPEPDVSNAMVGLKHSTISCTPTTMNGRSLNPETDICQTVALAHESTVDDHSNNANMKRDLVDTPLDFASRVGDSDNGNNNHDESGMPNGFNCQQQQQQQLSINDKRSRKTDRERSDTPVTFPSTKRSVRQRLYFPS